MERTNHTQNHDQDTIRATFAMKRGCRDLLRGVAHRYDVSQSEIMNNAPFLFLIFAEQSLTARRQELEKMRTLAEQAKRSLAAMSEHTTGPVHQEAIEDSVELEAWSVSQNQVHGPDEGDIEEKTHRAFVRQRDPFTTSVCGALSEMGRSALSERYRALVGNEELETFVDEEEKRERDALLADILADIDAAEVDASSDIMEDAADESETSSNGGSYRIGVPDRVIEAQSIGRALARFLAWLYDRDRDAFDGVAHRVRGRMRPLLATAPEKLYPGNPDLSQHHLQVVPGWYVGTNYSFEDLTRLVQAAAETAGLTWNMDVTVSRRRSR